MAIAIMIAASGTAAADTFYLECTTTPNTMGVPMVGGLGCRQVPSHLIIRLPEADPSAQAPLPQEGASTEATPIDAPDTAPPKTEEADRQPLLNEVAAPVETVSPQAERPKPSELPSNEAYAPQNVEPKPGILVLPGGSKSQPAPAQAPAQAPDAKDEAKKELMKEIEAIRKQMMEINNQLLESGGG